MTGCDNLSFFEWKLDCKKMLYMPLLLVEIDTNCYKHYAICIDQTHDDNLLALLNHDKNNILNYYYRQNKYALIF